MVMVEGLGALELFIDTEEGAAFVTDNQRFMTSTSDFSSTLLLTTDCKDPSCKFQITLLPSGKILLQDFQGLYMSVLPPTDISFTKPEFPEADLLCEFEPYYEDDHVALKAYNGMYLRRIHEHHQERHHFIEPSGRTPDESCRFRLVIGDQLLPAFGIRTVEIRSLAKVNCKPCVVTSLSFLNEENEPKDHTFTLNWETVSVDTTTWSRAWGMDFKSMFNFPLMGMEGRVSYNGSYKKAATFLRHIREVRTVTVTVPPNRMTTASLVASMQEEAEVPFVATISKLRAGGNKQISMERGKWKGLVYDSLDIDVIHDPRKVSRPCRVM